MSRLKVEMTKGECVKMWNSFNSVKRIKDTKFQYFVARNCGFLKSEIDALAEAQKPDEKVHEYEQKRMELIRKYAAKDEKGGMVPVGNGFQIADMDKFEADVKILDEEYKELLEENKKKNKDFEELLKDKVTFEMYTLKFADLPKDIDGNEMEQILKVITETP